MNIPARITLTRRTAEECIKEDSVHYALAYKMWYGTVRQSTIGRCPGTYFHPSPSPSWQLVERTFKDDACEVVKSAFEKIAPPQLNKS